MLLETYSSLEGEKLLNCLPKFLNIVKEATGDPSFSMFNLSLKEDWSKTKKFCHSLHGKDQRANQLMDHHHCGDRNGSNGDGIVVQTNGTGHRENKVHCDSRNNHEIHMHNDCRATDNAAQMPSSKSSSN